MIRPTLLIAAWFTGLTACADGAEPSQEPLELASAKSDGDACPGPGYRIWRFVYDCDECGSQERCETVPNGWGGEEHYCYRRPPADGVVTAEGTAEGQNAEAEASAKCNAIYSADYQCGELGAERVDDWVVSYDWDCRSSCHFCDPPVICSGRIETTTASATFECVEP